MREEEIVYPNDTTSAIRRQIEHIKSWSTDNDRADPRHVAMVLTKLEEAELLSMRMVKQTEQ